MAMNNESHYIPNSFPVKVPFPPPIEESELKPSMKMRKLDRAKIDQLYN